MLAQALDKWVDGAEDAVRAVARDGVGALPLAEFWESQAEAMAENLATLELNYPVEDEDRKWFEMCHTLLDDLRSVAAEAYDAAIAEISNKPAADVVQVDVDRFRSRSEELRQDKSA
jgi:hypothetical protein